MVSLVAFWDFLNTGRSQSILLLALLIATVYYAYYTQRMAALMYKEHALKYKPYATLDKDTGVKFLEDPTKSKIIGVQFFFKIINVGMLPIKFKKKVVAFNGKLDDSSSPELVSFPQQPRDIWSKVFKLGKKVDKNKFNGQGTIEITCWATRKPAERYCFRRTFEIKAGELDKIYFLEEDWYLVN